MRAISGRALGFLALCGFATSASAVTGNSVLQGQVNGSTVTIITSQQMAGAIVSLVYRGKEYIDSYDHGRELQSAISYNNVGECFNPTEAGGRNDGASSTSQIFRQTSWQSYLITITRMSFWLRGNEYYPQGCGPQFPSVTQAMHPANVSDHFLAKNVTLGYRTLQNVLEYRAKFTVPTPSP